MSNYNSDTPNMGLNILAFLIPFVGLFLVQSCQESAPCKAAAIRKFTIGGFVAWIVVGVLSALAI